MFEKLKKQRKMGCRGRNSYRTRPSIEIWKKTKGRAIEQEQVQNYGRRQKEELQNKIKYRSMEEEEDKVQK